ncbi:2-methylaconitate cis-trans isomerase PrpF family protein [Gordonia aquimaris]|uniref:PrpF protein n=1 Tax=Gordonia aquimaris TaxID=2984863 RepID=A0A9X3D1J5_9ACTN|nr:PrpF domain-containing protein [Gordonia aquimaris]MCX2963200.1 PrpF protein [Gordonia aquimaris]
MNPGPDRSGPQTIPAVLMRGGTSKGVYFHVGDLPADRSERDEILLRVMGSPDPLQIDGLGGSRAITSKVAIVGPSTRSDADVDYTFAQVAVDQSLVQWNGNCGNISAGVGPFAVDEGLVSATDGITRVRIFNTNTGKVMTAYVPVTGGRHNPAGTFAIPGVPGTGAEIVMDWSATIGSRTGKLLPTDNVVDLLTLSDGSSVPVTICDVANPAVWVSASSIQARGNESKAEIDESGPLLRTLQEIRARVAEKLRISPNWQDADKITPGLPVVGMVAPPSGYTTIDGTPVAADRMDLSVRLLFMGKVHESLAGTASVNLAAASRTPGTVVADAMANIDSERLHAGHPSGVMSVSVACEPGEHTTPRFHLLGMGRTARRIADCQIYL